MTRRRLLRKIKELRRFRDTANSMGGEDDLHEYILEYPDVQGITIKYGWTTYISVTLNSGIRFTASEFWENESFRRIANQIYKYEIGKLFNSQ